MHPIVLCDHHLGITVIVVNAAKTAAWVVIVIITRAADMVCMTLTDRRSSLHFSVMFHHTEAQNLSEVIRDQRIEIPQQSRNA